MDKKIRGSIVLLLCYFWFYAVKVYSQSTCDVSTPSFTFDLSGNPDSTWISPEVRRSGLCCDIDPNERPPVRCVEFFFTLDSSAIGIIFDIASGAIPPGALYYQINCQGRYQFGDLLCLDGPGPYRLTFCKPGNNPNTYSITSVGPPRVSPPVAVSDGCSAFLTADGYDPATIQWRSVPSDSILESYLDCLTCDSVNATWQAGAPDTVIYEVSGIPIGGCSPTPVVRQTAVIFINDKVVQILPQDPAICFGSTGVDLTANISGGVPPYVYVWNTGDTSQTIRATVEGNYWVEVFDNTSCPTAGDTVTVTAFLNPIIANADADVSVCADNPSVMLNGSVTGVTTGVWSGGNGIYTPNDSTLNATYTPTQAEIDTGSITLTLTTTNNATCPPDSDQVTLSITPTPIVVAGSDEMVCANNPSLTLNGSVTNAGGGRWSGGSGTFFPNDSTLNAIYTPGSDEITNGSATLILTSIQNGTCNPVSDTILIIITPAPTIDAGPNISTCANNISAVLSGSVTVSSGGIWSGGAGTFSPSNTDLNASYTPSSTEIANGTVTLTITSTGNGNCNAVTDDMTIFIAPSPIVDAGPNQVVCANNSQTSLNGAVNNATGGQWLGGSGIFSPDRNTLQVNYDPSASEIGVGNITLILESTGNGSCVAVTDEVTITITPAPTADAGPDQTVCANNASVNLNGSVTIATDGNWISDGDGTFSPDANSLSTSYTPGILDTTTGIVNIVLTTINNNNCLPVTDSMVINITPAPVINAGPDVSICSNNATAALNGTVSSGFDAVWVGGNGVFSPNRNNLTPNYVPNSTEISTGFVTLTLLSTNNGNCVPVSDDMVVNITPAPVVNILPDSSCSDNPQLVITAQVTSVNGLSWAGGNGLYNYDSASYTLTYTPTANEVANGFVTLNATSINNGNCLAASDNAIYNFTPIPTVDAGPDQTICTGTDTVSLLGSITITGGATWSTSGSGNFLPSSMDLDASYIPSHEDSAIFGTVTITLTTDPINNCNIYTDNLELSFATGPTINAGMDDTICTNDFPIQLSAAGSPGRWIGNGGMFSPDSTSLNSNYTPSTPEVTSEVTTLVFLTDSTAFCPAITDTVIYVIPPGPTVNAGPDMSICSDNGSVDLVGAINNVSTAGWTTTGTGTFSPDSATLSTTYNLSGAESSITDTILLRFTLTTTDTSSCSSETDQVDVLITPSPTINAGADLSFCADVESFEVSGNVTISSGGSWTSSGDGIFVTTADSISTTYEPSVNDTAVGSILLTLTSTGNGSCSPVNDTKMINFQPVPIINAGPDTIVCDDVSSITLNGMVVNATGGIWSSSGSGIFSPSTTQLSTYYLGAPSDTVNGGVTLTLTSTGNGICDAVTDELQINFTDKTSADAGPDLIVCSDTAYIDIFGEIEIASGGLWSTSGAGTFQPSDTSLIAQYIPDPQDLADEQVTLTLETTGNGDCFTRFDDMTITFTQPPTIEAGPDLSICQDGGDVILSATVTIASGAEWTTTNGGGMISVLSSLTSQYTTIDNDTSIAPIHLFATTTGNGMCKPVVDSTELLFTPPPTIDAGADQVLCYSSTSTSLSASYTIATGVSWSCGNCSGVFSPGNSYSSTSYFFSNADKAQGLLTFVATTTGNGTCQPRRDTMIVTFSDVPVVDAGDGNICSDASSIELFGTAQNSHHVLWTTSGTGTFTSDTSTTTFYNPSASDVSAGSVTITFTGISCVSRNDELLITFTPPPNVTIDSDTLICSHNSLSLEGTVTNAGGGLWSASGGGAFSPNNSSLINQYAPSFIDINNGYVNIYIETTGNGNCDPAYDTIYVEILPAPTANAGSDDVVCAELTGVTVNGSISNATVATWTTAGTGTFSPENSENTVYTPSQADVNSGSVSLTLTASNPGSCNPPVSDNMRILFAEPPIVDAGPAQVACADDAGVAFDGSIQNATGGTWTTTGTGTFSNPNSTQTEYFFTQADAVMGKIIMTLTSTGNGLCDARNDTVSLTIAEVPNVDAGADRFYCADVPLVPINGSVTIATEWDWSTPNGTGTFSPDNVSLTNSYQSTIADTTLGQISIWLTANINGGCLGYDYFDITYFQAPEMVLVDTPACIGDIVYLVGDPSNVTQGIGNYEWYRDGILLPGDTTNILEVDSSGVYRVYYELDNCVAVDSADIDFFPRPVPDNDPLVEFCSENQGYVEVDAGPAVSYYWYLTGDSTRYIDVESEGFYEFDIFNEYKCPTHDSVFVWDVCPPRLFVPTIFSPNGDGTNDEFMVFGAYFKDFELLIFNRWGEIIFRTNDRNHTWDGNYLGEPMPIGVYNWRVTYDGLSESFGGPFQQKGSVTIVR